MIKKVSLLVLMLTMMFSMAVFAAEEDTPVEHVVGEDIILEEGEMGITAVEEAPLEENADQLMRESGIADGDVPISGEGLELEDGEMGITSIDGEEVQTISADGDEEALPQEAMEVNIISAPVEEGSSSTILYVAIAAGIVVLLGVVLIARKRSATSA